MIETARGPVAPEALGRVLMHEHVFVLDHEMLINYPDSDAFEAGRSVDDAVVRLNELVDVGIGTIVDLTVTGLGRDVSLLKRVAEQTALNIVVATGHYTFDTLPHFVHSRARFGGQEPADLLASWYVGDITDGIADTGVRAGILKCATDHPGVTPGVEAVLRAVARAHVETGAPISTHTQASTKRGLEQQDVFESEGVDLSKVVIGHSGDTADLGYLEELISRGSYLGMDRFGIYRVGLSRQERVRVVAELCARGHASRLVLSHDAACYNHWLGSHSIGEPDWNYCHISRDVVPALQAAGVTDESLNLMLIENPRRILDWRPATPHRREPSIKVSATWPEG